MLNLLRAVLAELLVVLKLTATLLRYFVWGLTVRPRGFGDLVQVKEEFAGMAQKFTYRQALLPVPDGVASQRLVITVNGVDQEPIAIAANATEVEFRVGPAGATFKRTLDYLDAAGNDSDNFESTEDVVVDGIAPAAPAGFGELTQIGEEDDGT